MQTPETIVNEGNTLASLPFTPSGTTNYLMTTFNTNTKARQILHDGAVPLHKITSNLYDFFYSYLNMCPKNNIYHLTALSKPDGDSRPVINIMSKIPYQQNKKKRKDTLQPILLDVIAQFDTIFGAFINKLNQRTRPYRSDTNQTVLTNAYDNYNNKVKTQLMQLIS